MTRRILFLLTLASPAFGQQALMGAGAAYFSSGGASITTKDLDDRLDARGYPTFGQHATEGGIGGYRLFRNHVVFGVEITGVNAGTKPHGGGEVGLSGGYAT